ATGAIPVIDGRSHPWCAARSSPSHPQGRSPLSTQSTGSHRAIRVGERSSNIEAQRCVRCNLVRERHLGALHRKSSRLSARCVRHLLQNHGTPEGKLLRLPHRGWNSSPLSRGCSTFHLHYFSLFHGPFQSF